MKRTFLTAAAIGVALFLPSDFAFAKRAAPAPVAPVETGDVRLVVKHFDNACGQTGGCVEVVDRKSGAPRRAVKVYTTKRDPKVEGDVQDVFITALTVTGTQVKVTDEEGRSFTFNL